MSQSDFIPENSSAFVVWFTKFILHLQALSPKYALCSEKIDGLLKDHEWVHYWAWMRSDVKEQERHLNRFFNAVVNGSKLSKDLTMSVPIHDSAEALAYLPENVMPGIKQRIYEIAVCIKSQTGVYSKEDGRLLGILTPQEAGWAEEDYVPDLKFKQLPDYSLEVDFRKFGMDAVKYDYRYVGDEWLFGGFLTKSPDILKIPPLVFGCPEQIEISAIFWSDNQPYGNRSPVYRMVIVP